MRDRQTQVATQYLEDRAVRSSQGVFWNMQCIAPLTIFQPNSLHTVYLGMVKHLLGCVASFFKHHSRIDEVNQLRAWMSPYPGFT
jgi:hypothetical protein